MDTTARSVARHSACPRRMTVWPRPRTRLAGKRSRRVRRRAEVEAGPGLGCPIPAQHQDLGQQTSAPGALPRCMELKSVDVPRRQLRCQANALARGARDGTIRRRRDAWEPSAVVARAHARSGPCGKAQTNCAQRRLCPRSGCVRLARSSSVSSVEAANHGSVRLLSGGGRCPVCGADILRGPDAYPAAL